MGNYVFTPARAAALAKARAARKRRSRRFYSNDPVKRGQGIKGLKKNTIPYVRVNKRSQTVGFNAGTVLPKGKRRIVVGGYARIENVSRKGKVEKALSQKIHKSIAPKGTKRGHIRSFISQNVQVRAPGIRTSFKGNTVSLGTSRGAGPTVIVRRGRKPTPYRKTNSGIRKYDTRMRAIAGQKVKKKKSRPQRRGKRSL